MILRNAKYGVCADVRREWVEKIQQVLATYRHAVHIWAELRITRCLNGGLSTQLVLIHIAVHLETAGDWRDGDRLLPFLRQRI